MNYSDIIRKVSKELNIPKGIVNNTYKSYWLFIRNTIEELSLKEDLDELQFSKLRINFNIESIGKLNVTYKRLLGCKERYKRIKKIV